MSNIRGKHSTINYKDVVILEETSSLSQVIFTVKKVPPVTSLPINIAF